jgi:glycosyltransferase involved in cell wall biosynthesis
MQHIEFLPYDSDMLASLYAGAKVHVLLGQNETPGIVNLEAGLAGANLVVGDCVPVREYLKEYALYTDYNSIDDIKEKVVNAYNSKRDTRVSKFIENNYTWNVVAEKTLLAYKSICE